MYTELDHYINVEKLLLHYLNKVTKSFKEDLYCKNLLTLFMIEDNTNVIINLKKSLNYSTLCYCYKNYIHLNPSGSALSILSDV